MRWPYGRAQDGMGIFRGPPKWSVPAVADLKGARASLRVARIAAMIPQPTLKASQSLMLSRAVLVVASVALA